MRRLCGAFGVLLALVALPAAAEAQGRTCRQVLRSDFRRLISTRGQEMVYFRDPVRFLCTGGVRLEADSAVVNRGAATVELIGSVVYRDSTRALNAGWANYLGPRSQLLARDSVILEDAESGAVITGDDLNYLRESETRPVARMIVTGRRPHAIIPPRRPAGAEAGPETRPSGPVTPADRLAREGAPAREDAPIGEAPPAGGGVAGAEPDSAAVTEVWADRMELVGEDVFMAEGDVEIERGDITGAGNSARFDQAEERMTLIGAAHVRNDLYRLDGDRIEALTEGDALREVRSHGAARVTSEELKVRAEEVRLGFSDGELERMEAWNPDPEVPRARADSRDFQLRADSIDARADSVGIRELRAVGRAYGERTAAVDPAAADTAVPVVSPALPGPVSRDWIQGDTILGYFGREEADTGAVDTPDPAPDPESGPESDSTRVVLERIVVIGGTGVALSLYRMAPEEPGQRPVINFMKANRIILHMERGDVARVEAEGPIEGLYLSPRGGVEEGGGAPGSRPGGAEGGGT